MISFTWFCCGFIFSMFLITHSFILPCFNIQINCIVDVIAYFLLNIFLSIMALGWTLKVFVLIEVLGIFNISKLFGMPLL